MTAHFPQNILRAGPLAAFIACTAGPVVAQVPNTLLHTIPPPPGGGAQTGASLGWSIAMEGAYIVVGAPFDATGGEGSGVVKVFNSTTGALLFVLPNPSPAVDDRFGWAVALSGTHVVVGADGDDTGALNTGSAYVFDLAGEAPTIPVVTLNNPGPALNESYGESVAISGASVIVGAHRDDTGAIDAGSVYVYDLGSGTTAVPVLTLHNPAPAAEDGFGYSVAVSGTRLVVGAYPDDMGNRNAGSAYVYDLTSGTPTVPVSTLHNPEPAMDDWFAFSVAIDGTRIVVGAVANDTGAMNAGSAYVYDLSSGTPMVPVATFNHSGLGPNTYFGTSVAISGTRVVVGADHDWTALGAVGKAYVYDLASDTPLVPVVSLIDSEPEPDDWYGYSVAIAGTRVAVGAPLDNTRAYNAGSVYVYELSGGTPTEPLATLNHPSPTTGDNFGGSVAISGSRTVVGAAGDDTGAEDAGSAYVYDLSIDNPTVPMAALNNPSPAPRDGFGRSVGISGNWVVVGAYQTDGAGANVDVGSAYVYDLASVVPALPVAKLNNPSPARHDFFGQSVAISGTWVVVGASYDDSGEADAGSVYVYDMASATPAVPVATLNNPTPAFSDWYGNSVAISGTNVVVGAYEDDTGATSAGSAYVYDMASSTPTLPVVTLNNPGPPGGVRFGISVAIAGALVVVGAPGSAYVYDLASATPTVPSATLSHPTPAGDDQFGSSVTISGTRVVVGASRDDTWATNAGNAYVYELTSARPTVPVTTLQSPNPANGNGPGSSVAIDGVTVAIGVSSDDTVLPDKGMAYIFGPHPLDQDSDGLRDAWEIAQFGATAGHGPLDDYDHDGYNELLELALGLNPTFASPGGLPEVINEDGYLTMTIAKQPGASYEVQSAGTLLPSLPGSFGAASTTVLLNDATTIKVRDNTPIGTQPGRFMRVKVTAVP